MSMHGPDGDPADPDSNAARLERHREFFRTVPKGHVPPPSAAVVAMQERLEAVTQELADARRQAEQAATILRKAWEILDPTQPKSGP